MIFGCFHIFVLDFSISGSPLEALHPPTCHHQPAAVTQATCRSMGHKLSERAPAIQDGLKLVEMPGVCW